MHQGFPLLHVYNIIVQRYYIHFLLEVIVRILHFRNNESLFTLDEGIVHYVMATINVFLEQMKVLFIWFYG